MEPTTTATSTTDHRCAECGEPGTLLLGHSNAERDEKHPFLVRAPHAEADIYRSKQNGELVRVYGVVDKPDEDIGIYLLAPVSWDEQLGEPLPTLCTWSDLEEFWEPTPMRWIVFDVVEDGWCETCGNASTAPAHREGNYDYHSFKAAPADSALVVLRDTLEKTYRDSPFLDDFGGWAVAVIDALRSADMLREPGRDSERTSAVALDSTANERNLFETKYWRDSIGALTQTMRDNPELLERVLSGEYKASDQLIQLLSGPHDHGKQLQHIVDEWGLNGVLQRLLGPLSDSARTDVLNAAFRGMKVLNAERRVDDTPDLECFEVGGFYRHREGGGMLHVIGMLRLYDTSDDIADDGMRPIGQTPEGRVLDLSRKRRDEWERATEREWLEQWGHVMTRNMRER